MTPASRLDHEPPILAGCTRSELFTAGGVSFAVWTPLGVALAIFMPAWILGVAAALAGAVATVALILGAYRGFKRGRPEGWHLQQAGRLLALRGLRLGLVVHVGPWSGGRGL